MRSCTIVKIYQLVCMVLEAWESRLFPQIYDSVQPADRVKYGVLNAVSDPPNTQLWKHQSLTTQPAYACRMSSIMSHGQGEASCQSPNSMGRTYAQNEKVLYTDSIMITSMQS